MRYSVAFALVVLLILIAPYESNSQIVDPDLIIYFDYEEFKGDIVIDKSGHGYNGKINGKVSQVDGKRGKAAKFERSSFLDLSGPNVKKEDIPTEAMSVCAWINVDDLADHHAIFNARAADATWLVHPEARGEGNFRWLLRGNGGATIFDIRAGKVTTKTWIHYTGTYSSKDGIGILYIDGEKVGEAPGKIKVASDWGMGARVGFNIDNARPFTGLMDDLCVWKKSLTQDEVKALMVKGPIPEAVSAKDKMAISWGRIKQ